MQEGEVDGRLGNGVGENWGVIAGKIARAKPPGVLHAAGAVGLVMLMAPASGGMFCCRNDSAALFLPWLC